MPIYEYKCNACGSKFELLIRASQKPSCPKCNSKRLKKLMSVFGVASGKPDCPKGKRSSRGGCGCACSGRCPHA